MTRRRPPRRYRPPRYRPPRRRRSVGRSGRLDWLRRIPRRRLLAAVLAAAIPIAVVVAVLVSGRGHPLRIAPRGTHGYDVSWPQCAGSAAGTMPPGEPSYLILGLTHGAGHTVNPCLGAQLQWARHHGTRVGTYLVATYPSAAQLAQAGAGSYGLCDAAALICRLRNDGAAQAQQAVATMTADQLRPPRVWIDVEMPPTHPWSRHVVRNRAVLQGVVRGLTTAGFPVGVYTTSFLWGQVVGDYHLDVPNWLPSGDGVPQDAQAKCATTATGGPTWLVQYTRTLDSDLTCPVLGASPGRHGALWPYRLSTQSRGSTGPAVRALQLVVGVPVTGAFDAATAAGVSRWQRAKGLAATGTIAPVDWRAMGAYQLTGGHGFLLTRIATLT